MKNQKGFALVLSLVLLVVMSLMGGALIVVASGDHQTNNVSDNYQQTFYVAETALLEGEKYLINQHLGPWQTKSKKRGSRDLTPLNKTTVFLGDMTTKNYDHKAHNGENWYIITGTKCFNSFTGIKQDNMKVVVAQSNNFGILVDDSLSGIAKSDWDKKQIKKLKNFYYEFFISRVGSASFSGAGTSIKKGATDETNMGIAYKIYGCGIYGKEDRMVVALESSIVLPRQ